MQFKETISLVLSGHKTATRRLIEAAHSALTDDAGHIVVVLFNGMPIYRVGNIYAVQPGRGLAGVGYIRLLGIERATLGDMTEADARTEGFADLAAFRDVWTWLHGAWRLEQEVWALRFTLAEAVA